VASPIGEANQEDGWVVCRVFKKKNHLKAIGIPKNCSSITSDAKTQLIHSASDEALDHILQYTGRSCKQETEKCSNPSNSISFKYLKPIETIASMHERFMKLPALESPTFQSLVSPTCKSQESQENYMQDTVQTVVNMDESYRSGDGITDWAAMDRLVASHLNGQADPAKHDLAFFDEPGFNFYPISRLLMNSDADEYTRGASVISSNTGAGGCDGDLWSFARMASSSSGSKQLSHVSL
jgi:hypothetical protein